MKEWTPGDTRILLALRAELAKTDLPMGFSAAYAETRYVPMRFASDLEGQVAILRGGKLTPAELRATVAQLESEHADLRGL